MIIFIKFKRRPSSCAQLTYKIGQKVYFLSSSYVNERESYMSLDLEKFQLFAVTVIFLVEYRLHLLRRNLVCRFIIKMSRSSSVLGTIEHFSRVMYLGLRKIPIIFSFHSFSSQWLYILKMKFNIPIYYINI